MAISIAKVIDNPALTVLVPTDFFGVPGMSLVELLRENTRELRRSGRSNLLKLAFLSNLLQYDKKDTWIVSLGCDHTGSERIIFTKYQEKTDASATIGGTARNNRTGETDSVVGRHSLGDILGKPSDPQATR